jgi:hypothetical protein
MPKNKNSLTQIRCPGTGKVPPKGIFVDLERIFLMTANNATCTKMGGQMCDDDDPW